MNKISALAFIACLYALSPLVAQEEDLVLPPNLGHSFDPDSGISTPIESPQIDATAGHSLFEEDTDAGTSPVLDGATGHDLADDESADWETPVFDASTQALGHSLDADATAPTTPNDWMPSADSVSFRSFAPNMGSMSGGNEEDDFWAIFSADSITWTNTPLLEDGAGNHVLDTDNIYTIGAYNTAGGVFTHAKHYILNNDTDGLYLYNIMIRGDGDVPTYSYHFNGNNLEYAFLEELENTGIASGNVLNFAMTNLVNITFEKGYYVSPTADLVDAPYGGAFWASSSGNYILQASDTIKFDGNVITSGGIARGVGGGAVAVGAADGNAGGSLLLEAASILFTNNTVTGILLSATDGFIIGGGALFINNNADVALGDAVDAALFVTGILEFSNNTVTATGNFIGSAHATIGGGAVYVGGTTVPPPTGFRVHATSEAEILFKNNSVTGAGGAIYGASKSIIEIHGGASVVFDSNSATTFNKTTRATGRGGAVYLDSDADFIVSGVNGEISFSNNSAGIAGGAIYTSGADIMMKNNSGSISFEKNSSSNGGAIYLSDGTVDIEHNEAGDDNLAVIFNGNSALTSGQARGGAINVSTNNSIFEMQYNTGDILFVGNSAKNSSTSAGALVGQGGAIYLSDGSLRIEHNSGDVVFAGNTVSRSRAGSENERREAVYIENAHEVILSADAGHTIIFYDGNKIGSSDNGNIYFGCKTAGEDHDGDGDVIFSGGAYAGHGFEYDAIGNLAFTELSGNITVRAGSLTVREGAIVDASEAISFLTNVGARTNLGNATLIVDGATATFNGRVVFERKNAGYSDPWLENIGNTPVIITGGVGCAISAVDIVQSTDSNPNVIGAFDITDRFTGKFTIEGHNYMLGFGVGGYSDMVTLFSSAMSVSEPVLFESLIRVDIVDLDDVTINGATVGVGFNDTPVSGNYWRLNADSVANWATTGFVYFEYIPEPSTAALGVLGLASLLLRRRRATKK